MTPQARRWLFGDQLGPHFLDDDEQRVLIVESRAVFARRRFHRQKAHLVLSAMRHRAAELGDRCDYIRSDTYRPALQGPLTVIHPTSHAALRFVSSLPDVEVLPPRGFATPVADFEKWANARGGRRLLMEDFYRDARRRFDILMDGSEPVGGRWNFDADNREPAPRSSVLGVSEPWWPTEDEIDQEVRADLDRWEADGDVTFIGVDGPRRFSVTHDEAMAALTHFLDERLDAFGPHEDAMLANDAWMAHSLLVCSIRWRSSTSLNRPTEADRSGCLRWRDSSGRSSAGGISSGTSTGTRSPSTATATPWAPAPRSRSGSPSWTPTPSTPGACPWCWPASATMPGCTTSRG
jgi:deoxyribodipyrimidine photolyase-related protein